MGDLETYSYPETIVPDTVVFDEGDAHTVSNKRSTRYSIEITQAGITKAAYVMHSPNPFISGSLSPAPDNHWANFSFDGTVTVTITRLGSNITSCELFPLRKGHTATIAGNQASFTLNESDLPLQLYAKINGETNHSLLIFADPLETDIPDRSDTSNVEIIRTTDGISTVRNKLNSAKTYAVFEEGIHEWGPAQGVSYPGYLLPYVSNKKIHLPGGAYVIGTFNGNNVSNSKIYGRGVLSACGKNRLSSSDAIPYSFVTSTSNGPETVEGIITTDPPHFHLTYRGEVRIDNVKMLGWWHQTDGIVTGDDSTIYNCFIKTNDDYMKLYSENVHCRNTTMFLQTNGAPFQFCWSSQNGDNNLAEDTYIVQSIFNSGNNTRQNTAVINSRYGSGAVSENNQWDGIYIDNGCQKLIGLNAENKSGTIFRNFTIRNVFLNSGDKSEPQDGGSYLENGNASNFDGVHFENLIVDGDPILASNGGADSPNDGSLWYTNGGGFVTYSLTAPPGFAVDAGADRTVSASSWRNMATLSLGGSNSGATGTPNATWSIVSGQGTANFRNANSFDSVVTLEGVGTWVLKLTGTDDESTVSDSVTITVQPPAGDGTVENLFTPVDDAYLQGTSRFNNNDLRVEAGNRTSYLKFQTSGLEGTVISAALELTEGNDTGNGAVRLHAGNSNNWTEDNLSPANAPAQQSELDSFSGNVGDGETVVLEAGSHIDGNGTFSLVVDMESGNDVSFGSSESDVAPVLRVLTAIPAPPSGDFASWQAAWFTAEEIANPALESTLWGANATPGAGLPNFARHTLGLSPFETAEFKAEIESTDSNQLVIGCDRASDATGTSIELEASSSLSGWDSAPVGSYAFSTEQIDAHQERARWTITVGPDSTFFRLSIPPEP